MLIPHTLAITTLGIDPARRSRQHRGRHPRQARAETAGEMNDGRFDARPFRQTQSYLRSLFARHGISPRRRLGQNFLIDLNIHDLIVEAAEVGPSDVILEVGSGTGALTSLMAARGAAVVAVDVDPAMARLTAEAVAGLPECARARSRRAREQKHDSTRGARQRAGRAGRGQRQDSSSSSPTFPTMSRRP